MSSATEGPPCAPGPGKHPAGPLSNSSSRRFLSPSPSFRSRAARSASALWLAQSWVPAYLAERGISGALRHWQIGYAPGGWGALTAHIPALGPRDDDVH